MLSLGHGRRRSAAVSSAAQPPPRRFRRYGSADSPGTGAGVTIYVLDSGIKLSHQEFKTADGTASRASYGAAELQGRLSQRIPLVLSLHRLKG